MKVFETEVRQVKKTASEMAPVKKKIRLQEWERQIEEQKTSGLSVQEWCVHNGIILFNHKIVDKIYILMYNVNGDEK